jgi:hypothetical protein
VAAFLAAWELGLAGAANEFMKLMRRLDLSDYSKIREVLLEVEGQPLGSYMLDVFDRVLQHEIEGDRSTIAAAQELNAIDPAKYPTPYIAGSSDLQDLVARLLWQNPERVKVTANTANTAGMPVSFGDVLVRRSRLDPAPGAARKDGHAIQGTNPLDGLPVPKLGEHRGGFQPVVIVHPVAGREHSALGREDAKRRVCARPIFRQALDRQVATDKEGRKWFFRFRAKEGETRFSIIEV